MADITNEELTAIRARLEQRHTGAGWSEFVGEAAADIRRLLGKVRLLLAEVEALRADNERLRASNDRAARNLAGYAHNASGYTVAEVEAVERELAEARADRDRLLTESAELRQALVRTVAHEAELVALLDPNNDEAVEIVRRAFRPPWSDRCNDASAWRVLTFLRDAANGEG